MGLEGLAPGFSTQVESAYFIRIFSFRPVQSSPYLFIELSNSLDIKVRDKNKRTNLGNIYLDKK